jgi:hypothetical protein
MKILFLAISLFTVTGICAQDKSETAIRNLLATQVNAWNAGDLEGFMKTYWHNDSLMFIGKSGVTYGWKNTLDNYKRSYKDTVSMGKLNFEILQIKRLSVMYYSVVGKWHLTRSIGDLEGHFTLLIKKIGNNWVIVADHSS